MDAEERFARLADAYLELLETYLQDLADSTAQGCQRDDGTLDSACLSTWAANIRTLAEHGRVRITKEYGRGVIAEWVPLAERPPLRLPAAFAATAPVPASDGWRETAKTLPHYDERVWVAYWAGDEWRVDVGWHEGAEWWLKSGTWQEPDGTYWMPIPPLPPAPCAESEKGTSDA